MTVVFIYYKKLTYRKVNLGKLINRKFVICSTYIFVILVFTFCYKWRWFRLVVWSKVQLTKSCLFAIAGYIFAFQKTLILDWRAIQLYQVRHFQKWKLQRATESFNFKITVEFISVIFFFKMNLMSSTSKRWFGNKC